MKFEQKLHMVWIAPGNTHREIPEDVKQIFNTWKKLEPDFEMMLWSLESIIKSFEDFENPDFTRALALCNFPAMQADLAALALVYKYGGFWSGLKNKPIVPFLRDLAGLQKCVIAEHFPLQSRPDPKYYVCNSFFGAPAGNSFLKGALDDAIKNVITRKQGSVVAVSGSGVLRQRLERLEQSGQGDQVAILDYAEFWGPLLKRTKASYDNNGMHWSQRQTKEPLYV